MTQLTVGVVAFSHTIFSVVVRTEASETVLQNGVSLRDQVAQEERAYYRFRVDSDDQPLVITLTSLTGDPDLFVSTSVTRPNASFCDWCAVDYGDDVVAIEHPTPGIYYIGVGTSFQASSYTITATVGPITLTPGQPLKDKLAQDEVREYIVRVSNAAGSRELELSLNMFYGTANVTVDTRGFPDDVDGPWGYWSAPDSVRVPISGTCPCIYYVQVRGLTDSSFTITASLGGTTHQILVSGVPVTTSVAEDEWVYFRALVEAEGRDVNVDLTTFVGDVDMYVSTSNQFPDSTTATWSLGTPNTHLTIAQSDPGFFPGSFYFGVHGRRASRFSLLLSTRSVRLKSGSPQAAVLSPTGNFFYATVNIPRLPDGTPTSEISFTANLLDDYKPTDALVVCVSTTVPEPSVEAGTCTWSLTLVHDQALIIAKNYPNFCAQCTYYLSVTAPPGQPTNRRFSVKLSTEDRAEILLDGALVRGQKSSTAYNYYEMWVGQSMGLEVSLSPCEGDADLYISRGNFRPTKDQYEWSSESKQSVDVVRIKEAESQTLFYIGVAPKTPNTNYMLVARTSPENAANLPQPGNEGKLVLSTPGAGLVRVEFNGAVAPAGYTGRLFYTVYFAKDAENRVMYTECGVRKTSSNGRAPAWEPTVVRTIGGLEAHTMYTVNVLVETEDKGSAIYRWAQIETLDSSDIRPGRGAPWGLILGLGIPILLGLAGLLAFLCFRNRRLTQALSVEMEGIPHSAVQKALAGPPSARQNDKPFNALLGSSAVASDDGEVDSRPSRNTDTDIEQQRQTAL